MDAYKGDTKVALHYSLVSLIVQPLSSHNLNIYHHDLYNCITKQ